MPPSSNKSVGSVSSNPKKQKKGKKKRDKDKSKEETKDSTAADKQHHKERKPKEPKESRRTSSGKSSSKRHRGNSLPRVYWLVLVVVALVLCGAGMYHYKRSTRSTQHATGGPAAPDTTASSARTEERLQQEPALPIQRRQEPINLRPLIRSLVHTFQRILTSFVESPFLFPEARATRLRSRALQEMRLNDEPLQDDPPYYSSPGYGPPPRPRRAPGRQLQKQREQHRAALQAIQPVMLNGQEQDCVSPRCLKDGSFPFFRWLENEQRRVVSPNSLCNFILHWGKGELELEASKATWMHGGGSEL